MDLSTLTSVIGGEAYTTGSRLDLIEPATNDKIGELTDVDYAGVDEAVRSASASYPAWRGLTPKDRAAALLAIADALDAHVDEFAELEARDVGKPLADARAEVGSAADKYRFFAGAARTMTTAAAGEYKPGLTSFIRREPIGVVAAITPWNYPMGLTSWKIAPALAAGNTVVLKPPVEASLTTLLLAKLAAEILPPGVLNVITGRGGTTGAALAAHPLVGMVSLTGGNATGSEVMRLAAPTVKKLHLELGGKAPVVVFADADLEKFAAAIKGAVFRNSGQDCTAATRVYVARSRVDDVLGLLEATANGLVVGNGFLDPTVEMGPVVSVRHQERILGMLERAQSSGARAVTGGGRPDMAGSFIEPTVLTGVEQNSEIMQEEVFGPVVSVTPFDSDDDAVALANDTVYGLAASVWTQDIDRAVTVAARIQAGSMWINTHGPTAAEMPFGGFKQSGIGRDLSVHALEDHTQLKHVAIAHGQTL